MRPDRGFRRTAHTADEGIEAWGPTYADACAQAALALADVMGTPSTLVPREPLEVRVAGTDRADAVVRALSRLLVAFEVEGAFVTGVRSAASADAPGGPSLALSFDAGRVDRLRERGLVEVKAVTYHGLSVEEAPGRTTVRATLDL